jgi:NAD(P)-dependent dehydrogenase (short-subunit alcohol dehydrogenase family)
VYELTGKVAVITGGGGGIGRVTARLLAERGAVAVVADLNLTSADAAASEITAAGHTAMAYGLDVSVEDEVRTMAATVVERFGGVDILHNNAAHGGDAADDVALTELDMDHWERAMAVSVRGYALMAKHLVPSMIERGGGVVINTASNAGCKAT